MGHFAKVIDGTVTKIIVAEPEFFDTFTDTEAGEWIQTSYNTRGGIHCQAGTRTPSEDQSKSLRKNFATVGGVYDADRDAFYEASPFPSWVMDEDTCYWDAPVTRPNGGYYLWNEETTSWDIIEDEETP
jgi:hypothetical protein